MIKPIVRDAFFLNQRSEEATKADLPVVQDLEDTLKANRERCVGMAANMIGYRKRIIIAATGFADIVMINPVITAKSGEYETEEGCLSLPGVRKTKRYNQITVRYLDRKFTEHTQTFSGYIAQIIQHECDHLEGILI
ncbi:MAG: peptide deformylase [Mogibacterium sp.]|jgi:peptide deformylase|nr:peptide deformylase [Mogibacterium sp.]MBQ6499775.1 peptide deformylase [Mogibacterium sp.]